MDLDRKYLPDRLNAKGVRWAYDGCPGLSTDDLLRAPYAPARGLVRMPERLGAGRRPVRNGYVIGTRAEAMAAAIDLSPLETASRPFGEVAFVESPRPTVAARERKAVGRTEAVEAIRPRLDGSSPVVLSDHEMMAALGITPIRMGEMD